MFLAIFSLSLLIANVLCFKNKTYLYLFIPCMLFLPDYYGFDINDSLPILSINRIMYFIFYIYVIFNHRRAIDIHNIKLNTIPRFYYYLGGYFIFRCFTNLYYVTSYNQAVKTLFLIIFQQLFLLIAIYFLAPTKDELHRLIKIVIYTAAFLFYLEFSKAIHLFV
ncbi:hypothetical protein CIY_25740 [Butyrivibrio fibrisolvens 16/4]|nr:hypothetical protein CIY_25740 [Butyrivibrio fibrisolvens 16/4]